MITVALIGVDGAGKTTVARKLEQSDLVPIKYMYLGLNTQSSNYSLFTSKFAHIIKKRSYKKQVRSEGGKPADDIPPYYYEANPQKRSFIWTTGRFLNRIAEIVYRLIISRRYIRKGYVVLFDRHILYEAAPDYGSDHDKFANRFFYWLMNKIVPRPDITILLDAPVDILYERKKESTPEHLERRRTTYIELGKKFNNFIKVDATQTPNAVFEDANKHIGDCYQRKQTKAKNPEAIKDLKES